MQQFFKTLFFPPHFANNKYISDYFQQNAISKKPNKLISLIPL